MNPLLAKVGEFHVACQIDDPPEFSFRTAKVQALRRALIQEELHEYWKAIRDLNPAELPKSVPVTAERTTDPTTFAVVLPTNRDASEDSIIEYGAFGRSLVVGGLHGGPNITFMSHDNLESRNPRDYFDDDILCSKIWTTQR